MLLCGGFPRQNPSAVRRTGSSVGGTSPFESVLKQCLSVVPGDAVLLEIMVKLLLTVVMIQFAFWSQHSFLNSGMQNSVQIQWFLGSVSFLFIRCLTKDANSKLLIMPQI